MRGTILELSPYVGDDMEIIKKYNLILKIQPTKLILLRELNNDKYLIAIARDIPTKGWFVFETNTDHIYVNIKSFYCIDKCCCKKSHINFPDPIHIVNKIYDTHNQWLHNMKINQKAQRKLKNKKNYELLKINKTELMTNRDKSEEIKVSNFLQWAAKHPYQGGRFSNK